MSAESSCAVSMSCRRARTDTSAPDHSNSESSGSGAGASAPGGRSCEHVEWRGAHQAVAGHQVMIEKRQRPIGRQRREPHRQLRQLHGHRIAIHAEQAPAGDQPACRGPIGVREVALGRVASLDRAHAPTRPPGSGRPRPETRRCPLPDPGRAATGSRRATAPPPAEPACRAPARRRSRAACRRCRWSCAPRWRMGASGWRGRRCLAQRESRRHRLEIEQALVDRAELLHAKLRVRDALPAAVQRRAREAERVERAGHAPIVECQVVKQRRACGREQPTVERRDPQVAGLGARVREPRDGLKRCPCAPRRP